MGRLVPWVPVNFAALTNAASRSRISSLVKGVNLVRALGRSLGEVEGDGAIDISLGHAHAPAFIFADGAYQAVYVHGVAGAQHFGCVVGAAFAEMLGAVGFGGNLLRLHD